MAVNNPFGNTGWKERIQIEPESSHPQSAQTVASNAVVLLC